MAMEASSVLDGIMVDCVSGCHAASLFSFATSEPILATWTLTRRVCLCLERASKSSAPWTKLLPIVKAAICIHAATQGFVPLSGDGAVGTVGMGEWQGVAISE
jgi:hypothetical protein